MPKVLNYGQLISRLKDFGVIELPERGKGSERYLVHPTIAGTTKGPSYTIRCHGSGDTVKIGTLSACLRRLQIDSKQFWKMSITSKAIDCKGL